MKLDSKRAQLVQSIQKFVPWNHVGIFHKECTRSTHSILNSCFGVFHTVWVPLGPFRRLMKFGSKQAELVRLMQKFVPWNCVRTFHNECSWSAPLDSKLMFWCVLLCLGAFRTVSMPYKIKFKTGRTGVINAKVCTVNSRRNFSQRTDLIHPIGP